MSCRAVFKTIINEAKANAERYKVADRVDRFAKSSVSITLKNHIENFQSKPKYRVINPAKIKIEKIINYS